VNLLSNRGIIVDIMLTHLFSYCSAAFKRIDSNRIEVQFYLKLYFKCFTSPEKKN
jgi:hypothetical protein